MSSRTLFQSGKAHSLRFHGFKSRLLIARMNSSSPLRHPNPIPATFLRGGTSKGIFLKRAHLPSSKTDWKPIFLGIMGSPDPDYGRQLNGMGGGVSSLSKICVVEPPTPEQRSKHNIDVQYTFVQVGIKDDSIDYSGNCGNLTSMIGAYALDERMCPVNRDETGRARVRCFNTNTKKVIDTTFPVSENGIPALNTPEASVAGVPGKASQIICEYLNPSGARTGALLPTSKPIDTLSITNFDGQPVTISASLVDATNPSVFILSDELRKLTPELDNYITGKEPSTLPVTKTLEQIRQAGARAMKLDPTAQAQPKIAFLSIPSSDSNLEGKVDVVVHALSMGVLHKATPMTLGLCLGVAAKVEGTLAWDIVQNARWTSGLKNDLVRIRHPGGIVDVGAEISADGKVECAKVVRTGRRLMKGVLWWR
ncbi:3-methylitaconate isomerase [Leucoagaricus sp. SymC.cos]|nr:3-methylitaconate isomerase [Leucoagaricus sp. SymC.cos]